MSTFMNGRYEKYFKNALEFKPERFLKSPDSESRLVDFLCPLFVLYIF